MKVQYFEAGLLIVVLLVVTALDWVMPALTRRDLFFGVTVAPNARETEAGRRIITRYRIGIIIVDILVVAGTVLLLALAPDRFWQTGLSAVVIIAAILLLGVPYLLAYFASRSLAVTPQSGEQSRQPQVSPAAELRPRHYSDYVPLIWELLPLAVIAATAAYLASQYASAPAIIATHFDAAGNANAFHPKTIGTYFALVWVQLGIYLLLTVLSVLMVGAKVVPGRADEGFRRIWLRILFGIKTLLMVMFGFLAIALAQAATGAHFAPGWIITVALVAPLLIIVAAFVGALRTGQGGARLDPATATATDRMNDHYWKYGAFYVNSSDPSLFVERRYGVGWTLNFGNPKAVAVFIGILAIPIAIAVLRIVFSATR